MRYQITTTDEGSAIVIFHQGEVYTATPSNPMFAQICAGAALGDESVLDLVNLTKAVNVKFERLTERVTVRDGILYFDGVEANSNLSAQVIRFMNEGVQDFRPLVNFYEKVMTNPNAHSRESLFTWLNDRDFTITEDGDFIGYRGLNGDFTSKHSGYGIVNGVEHTNSRLDNSVGNIVEIPRDKVDHDPSRGCSVGLHVGTWDYAAGWAGSGGRIVSVKVNPRDVVSVPTDCDFAKMRTCRYTVLAEVRGPAQSAVVGNDYSTYDEDYASDWDDDEDWVY
jgi:hypothetical protein